MSFPNKTTLMYWFVRIVVGIFTCTLLYCISQAYLPRISKEQNKEQAKMVGIRREEAEKLAKEH